jgi:hypothetical protein
VIWAQNIGGINAVTYILDWIYKSKGKRVIEAIPYIQLWYYKFLILNTKIAGTIIAVVTFIFMIIMMTPIAQVSNAVDSINTSTIDCNSKKGTADTAAGALKFGGAKCEGQNGGTVAAGGIKSGSGAIGLHGSQGPNDNSHFGGIIKR